MTEPRGRGRAWKPDATGARCVRCARTFGGHAGRSCYPVPDAAIDAFDPPRPDLLEPVDDADPSRRSSPIRPADPRDLSRVHALQAGRICAWCPNPMPAASPSGRRTRADAETCSAICRKRRNRFLRGVRRGVGVLALCPPDTRVCVWRQRVRVSPSKRALSAWEPLLVVGGREHRTDVSQQLLDDLETDDVVLDEVLDYRGRYDSFNGALVGMKPPEMAVWIFRQLGARAGDTLDDLYPGSGAIGRAWTLYTSLEAPVDAAEPSRLEPGDPSHGAAAIRPVRQVDVGQDASRVATVGPRGGS